MQKKIIILIILTVVIISAGLGVIGYFAVQESIDHSLQHRLELAKIIANNIDLLLNNSMSRLYDISLSGNVDLKDGTWGPETDALRNAYEYSIFNGGLFIVDRDGNVVFTYPSLPESHVSLIDVPYISKVIKGGKPVISDIYTIDKTGRKIIYILTPLKDKNGTVIAAVGGEVDPSSIRFKDMIETVRADKETYVEIVDSKGFVITSNNPSRMFKSEGGGHSRFLEELISARKPVIRQCHRCHIAGMREEQQRTNDIMAYAPLQSAHWGVSIIQPEKHVFAPAEKLEKYFLAFSVGTIIIALFLAVGMSKNIVRPIHELITATVKIAEGDMSKVIAFGGTDEIGKLSSSFEVMRLKLADSLDELQRYNAMLEQKVSERTKEINESRKQIKDLLKKVITSQEEERKRIAREFHDGILQDLAAMLIRVDVLKSYPESITPEKIEDIRSIIEKNIHEVYTIIKNLRPAILDDLGFEAAVRWLLDTHLESKGIACFVTISHAINTIEFEPLAEIELFRIIQEAITNIAKHAKAENVFVLLDLRDDVLDIEIEDDGHGFDPASVGLETDSGRGLGLLGMEERASFLNWTLKVCSSPGQGTRVSVKVPVRQGVIQHA